MALAPCVREALGAYRADHVPSPGTRYLFRSRHHADQPVSTSHLKKRFRRLCQRASVEGPHAHIHTTRHTVAVGHGPCV